VKIVDVQGLVKDYNSLRAVDHVDFFINEGECFGFLGPNGAGKTTVMRMLYCFIEPTAGSIDLFGASVLKDCSPAKLRIGVMPQDENLDLELSVMENLIVYARYFDMPRRKAKAVAAEMVRYVGLETKANVNIRQLSGGMKRSLLLARALVNDPAILILDEPTTGLDPHSRRSVWATLDELKARNRTLILTTHYMDEAERLCDRVAIMDRGRIIALDSPANLMRLHGANLEDVYLKLTGRRLED
jgi:lipooligosaccharide transport system ATP-binding protein